ncbi:iron transporter [Oxalobacteraceae sp. CFBP 13730]|nr:iron transporter [Oxalobacteraceae sp. CFBP 13730]
MTMITWRYRGGVIARAVAAIGGGYVLAALGGALIALALPLPRADAVTIATLLAFVIYPCVILWVFATRSAPRACVGVAATCAALGMVLWLVGGTA